MNKYQESLNTIKRCCEDRDGCYCSSIQKLQELIDHCEVLEKHFADQHNTEREQAMNEYQELYEGIELMCLCTDTYEDAEEYLKPLRELIEHYIVLEDAFTRACEHIKYENSEGKMDDSSACPKSIYAFTPNRCRKDKCRMSNEKCWKEWFLYLAKQKNRK